MKNHKFLNGVFTGIILVIVLNIFINGVFALTGLNFNNNIADKRKIKEIMSVIDTYYVNDVDEKKISEGVYAGIVAGLEDKYSYYMDKESFESFLESNEGNYVGIGVVVTISEDKSIQVLNVYENTPAYKAGIKTGDKIIKVDGKDVDYNNYEEAIQMIKGKENTQVKITVYRESEAKTIEFDVNRSSVDVPTVAHKMLENSIGYILISKFDGVTYDQFHQAYNDLTEQGMKGLIIDLRENPGGLLNTVVKITDMLVPEGYITYIEDKNGKKTYEYSDKEYFNKPLAIIVNGHSASASEVLSGAVKDTKAGKLVGTQTYGKGVVQNVYKLSDGSGVKVTIAKYYTPSGVCIDGEGITPDYVVELPEDASEDLQLNKAIEVIKEQIN